jgi:hypothetical protein
MHGIILLIAIVIYFVLAKSITRRLASIPKTALNKRIVSLLYTLMVFPLLTSCSSDQPPPPINNFCDYSISDYESLKPKIEAYFPVGLSRLNVKRRLKSIGVNERKTIQMYERIPNPDLKPWVKNNKIVKSEARLEAVYKNNKYVMSDEYILFGLTECQLPDKNKNNWQIEVYLDEEGNIDESSFFVWAEDENFASRNIPLRPSFSFGGEHLKKLIRSLTETQFEDKEKLKQYLLDAGFVVKERSGTRNLFVYMPSPLELNQLSTRRYIYFDDMSIMIVIDEAGKIVKVGR